MLRLNIRGSLLGTCAIAALSIGAANAQTVINGGGSTLAGPTYQAIFNNVHNQLNPNVAYNYAEVGLSLIHI